MIVSKVNNIFSSYLVVFYIPSSNRQSQSNLTLSLLLLLGAEDEMLSGRVADLHLGCVRVDSDRSRRLLEHLWVSALICGQSARLRPPES